MTNELTPAIYLGWDKLQKRKSDALDNRDQELLTIIDAQIVQFAQKNSIDLTSPVTLNPATPLDPKIHATEKGIDGNQVYKIKELTTGKLDDKSSLDYAIDGKKSTAAKVNDWLTVDIGDTGNIECVALKLEGTGDTTFTFEYSTNNTSFMPIGTGSATTSVLTANEFDYFTFPIVVRAQYLKIIHPGPFSVITLQLLENAPSVNPKPPLPPSGDAKYPIPAGFKVEGDPSLAFKFWGRTTTNYNSGGAGPSLRWDCTGIQSENVLAGYTFNLGTKHGKRGDDNIDLKCRGDSHSDGKGGWYIPWISWHGDGKSGEYGAGKEYPHPETTHDKFNIEDGKVDVGNIKDGKDHGFLVAVFNDKQGDPTMMAWFNKTGSNKIEDYEYLGKSKDKGDMKPGPVCKKIAQKGGGQQSLQVRMDEVPEAKIKNAFAYAISETPE